MRIDGIEIRGRMVWSPGQGWDDVAKYSGPVEFAESFGLPGPVAVRVYRAAMAEASVISTRAAPKGWTRDQVRGYREAYGILGA